MLRSCTGGEVRISPIAVMSVVGVTGVGDLKSNASVSSMVRSDRRGWKVSLAGFLAGWNK